jgi:nucleotide-binding universal stress UspA family protein
MKKRILLPTDFSQDSLNALRYGLDVYCNEACEFHILHIYYLGGYAEENLMIPKPEDKEYEKHRLIAESNMEKLKEAVESLESGPSHEFRFSTHFGPFLDVMGDIIKKDNTDLILMGTRSQSEHHNPNFGSVTVSVMESIRDCPVLAIPVDVKYKSINEIVFPTGFKTRYKEDDLRYLADFSQLINAPIRILYISKGEPLTAKQQKKKEQLESLFSEVTYTHHNLYNVPVVTGVRCFVQSRESEMMAFVNKKHFFFSSVFSDPMVKQLGRFTDVPLLALHDKKE